MEGDTKLMRTLSGNDFKEQCVKNWDVRIRPGQLNEKSRKMLPFNKLFVHITHSLILDSFWTDLMSLRMFL